MCVCRHMCECVHESVCIVIYVHNIASKSAMPDIYARLPLEDSL